ncbi:hypothetical protein K4L44_11025 [Halosquirtibacter laminarini]|uniref:Uncharacterized protein n=1 Tax=Halosquirtibacter laminarini TaxID=3374600 RepID=A0AC61NC78_9BACT|nr:hypothetical protein K4L44_11025 [Prolixibacteraceae bacterium]
MVLYIIICLYILLLFALGFRSHFRIKNSNDFIVAGRKGTEVDITGSLLATVVGSSAILGTLNLTVTQGWAALWFLFSASLGLWVLVPKVEEIYNKQKLTLPQLIGSYYGNQAKFISSAIIPIAWVGIVAAQIIGAAKILVTLTGTSYENCVYIAGFVLITYTVLGGQVSIIKTDKIQSVFIYIGLFVFTAVLLFKDGFEHVEPLQQSFPFNSSFGVGDLFILILTYSTTFLVGPDIYTRIFSSSSSKVAMHSVRNVAILLLPLSFVLCYVGMYINGLNMPVYSNGINFMAFVKGYAPETIFILCSLSLLSAVLSSADTTLLSASIILMDIRKSDDLSSLRRTRIIIVLLGLIATLIALKIGSIIKMLLTALSFYSGAFIIPVLAVLYLKQKPKGNPMVAMILGGSVALIGKVAVLMGHSWGNWIIVSAFTVNALCLFFLKKN